MAESFFSEKPAARWERDEKNLEREDGKDHYHSGSGAGSAVSGVIVFYVCGE